MHVCMYIYIYTYIYIYIYILNGSSLSQHPVDISNIAGVHGALYGTSWCDATSGSRGKAPKSRTILRYLKPENS